METMGISIVITILGWFLCRSILVGQMSNVHSASGADDYLNRNSIEMTEETDTYLYTEVTRRARSKS